MSDIKYRINLGNCGADLNSDIVAPTVIPNSNVKWDSTKVSFDSTIITFDHT